MIYRVKHPTSKIKGTIELTASKSESNRALIIQALQNGIELTNLADAKDTETMQALLANSEEIKDVGPAGTTMRFLTALFASKEMASVVMTGSQRMKERPIGILVNALRDLGVSMEYLEKDGYPPMKIEGKIIEGGVIEMDGSVSSQYVTALLLIAPYFKNGLVINFTGEIASRPYLQMTISMMKYFGAVVEWGENSIHVTASKYEAKTLNIEADWSAASYYYEIAALAKEADILLKGLKKESLQGDSVVAEIYEQFGVQTIFGDGEIRLIKTNETIPDYFEEDFDNCPDIAQTLSATCCALGIGGRLTGLKSLRIKETDRSLALKNELEPLGASLFLEGDDELHISSTSIGVYDYVVKTYHDHRMAMAFAPLALKLPYIDIENPNVVEKSYPDFWKDLRKIGFDIREV